MANKPKKIPDYVTFEQYQLLLKELKHSKAKKEYILSFVLGYEAGMRISEIVGYKVKGGDWIVPPLMPDKVDLKGNTIKIVSGKGSKDRIVPLPKNFNSISLKMLPLNIPRRTLQGFTSRITEKVLGKKMHFHSLRHGFGSRLANQGVPLHQIQMWMGHSRIDITAIYMHSSPTQENIDRVRDLF